jgi:biopolymer transport protein ExbD
MYHSKGDAGSRVTLPITAMLDMTFQLLFFFVVNFHPADLEGEMNMALPIEGGCGPGVAARRVAEPEFPIDLTVKVRTHLDGGISAIFVRNLGGKEEAIDGLGGLKKYLISNREQLSNKDVIKVQGDSKLKVVAVIEVMDVCRKAGFRNVGFVAPEDFGR